MSFGGAFETNIADACKSRCTGTTRGLYISKENEPCTYAFSFDNTYSWLRPKRVAYRISHVKSERTNGGSENADCKCLGGGALGRKNLT